MLLSNYKTLFRAVFGLSVAILLSWCVFLHVQNKKLSEGLETALNNVEVYQSIANNEIDQNGVLKLTVDQLKHSNDSIVCKLDSAIKANKTKRSVINTAATQTQTLYVNGGKGVQGDLRTILVDSTYTDSLKYNNLTTVYYTIGKDTVDVTIDLKNTQYLYTYTKKYYKNDKSFLKRLLTLDFKKVRRTEYKIENTNDLINTSDVRVIEIQK